MKRRIIIIAFFTLTLGISAKAQVSVGIYQNGVFSYLGVGTDPEKKHFGEARLFAGDVLNNFFGAELIGQRNFKQTDWYNFSAGLMVGYHEFDEGRVGIPAFFTFFPIQSNRNFSLILEATPFVAYSSVHLRGNLGIRYFLQKSD
jgi:hypothetical protein